MSTGVTIDFNADIARFTRGVEKVTKDLDRFQMDAERISGKIKNAFGSLGIGIGVGVFAALIKGSIDAQDHLMDLSKTTRLSVEELSGLASASKKSGSDLDGTAKAISKLAVEMGKDAEKFKLLGITAKSPLDAFAQLADVMNAIDDPQKRAAVGAAALGKSWQESAPLMAEGGKAIKEMIKLGQEMSKVTTESAKKADELNDKWEDLKTIAGGFLVDVANPITDGLLKIHTALAMEIGNKPGSISDFIFGQSRGKGWTGPVDAQGLPLLTLPAPPAAAPGKPSDAAVKKFIGGAGSKAGKTDLERMIELGQKNLAGGIDSEEEARILATTRAMKDATEEFSALQRMIKVGEANELATYYDEAGEETIRLVMQQRELQAAAKETDSFAKDLGLSFSSAFEDAIVGGKSFSEVLKGLGQDVARIITRKAITEPLGNAASNMLKNFSFGDLFKAEGGPVSGGQSYIVGERGPELFTPGGSGNITPNNKLLGGGTTNHFSVDMRGASVEAVSRLEQLVMSVNGSIERRAMNVMSQARVRG